MSAPPILASGDHASCSSQVFRTGSWAKLHQFGRIPGLFPFVVVVLVLVLATPAVCSTISASFAAIEAVADVNSLSNPIAVDFEAAAAGPLPGTSYDEIYVENGARFAERFTGQATIAFGDFDVLAGVPSGPLSLTLGATGENVDIFTRGGDGLGEESNVLSGLGPAGYPDEQAVGEGTVAILFDIDQREVAFDLVGVNAGTVAIEFFRRDASLVDSLVIAAADNGTRGFRTVNGQAEIAGMTVTSNDVQGIALDDLRIALVPEGFAPIGPWMLCVLALWRRRRMD